MIGPAIKGSVNPPPHRKVGGTYPKQAGSRDPKCAPRPTLKHLPIVTNSVKCATLHSTARQTCYVAVMYNAVPVVGELARHTVSRTVSGNGSLHSGCWKTHLTPLFSCGPEHADRSRRVRDEQTSRLRLRVPVRLSSSAGSGSALTAMVSVLQDATSSSVWRFDPMKAACRRNFY